MSFFRYDEAMEIHEAIDSSAWNQRLTAKPSASFLQSWEWGEFQSQVGQKVLRFEVKENGAVVAQLQGFMHVLAPGLRYLYLPKIECSSEIFSFFLEQIKNYSFAFIRIEPLTPILLNSFSCRNVRSRQPQHTLLLDLSKSFDELLHSMHSKTRYNIGLSERKGVIVKQEKNISVFWRLYSETTRRDGIRGHSQNYLTKILALGVSSQFTAYYLGNPVASAICVDFGNIFTYLHGASSSKHRSVMAPYLLQWSMIQHAKETGAHLYDFSGIAEPVTDTEGAISECFHTLCWKKDDPKRGITRFKAGFGGIPVSAPPAFDVVLSKPLYTFYNLCAQLLRKKV